METRPFRILDQKTMNQILELADEAGVHREAVRIPLAGDGDGRIERGADGVWQIVLPATGDLPSFLERIAAAFASAQAT